MEKSLHRSAEEVGNLRQKALHVHISGQDASERLKRNSLIEKLHDGDWRNLLGHGREACIVADTEA